MTEIASLSIYGTNFNDLNANGIRDLGEPGISGVVIHLTLNGAETLDTSTDASGNYSFVGLAPGICIVTEDQLPGRNQTAPEGGVYNITLVDEDAYHLDFGSCEVASGTLAMTYPEESSDDAFGESNGTGVDAPQEPVTVIDETPKLSINGTNFNDLNANGIRDSGEPGISGMVTHLTINGAETFDTSTDESGNYSFVDLVPGMYIVTENCVPGWNQTAPQGGAYNVTLTDKDAYNLDFGNCQIRFASSDLSDSASQDGR